MNFATNTGYLHRRLGLEGAVTRLADYGFTNIDVTLYNTDLPPYNADLAVLADRLVKIAGERGLSFTQAHAPFEHTIDKHIKEQLPLFPRVFEFAARLGIPHVVVHTLKDQSANYPGNSREMLDVNYKYFKSLAELSEQYGVKIAIENTFQRNPVSRKIVCSPLSNPEEHRDFYDRLNDPRHFTLCLDVGHSAVTHFDPSEAIRTLGGDRLGALHIQDNDYVEDLHLIPGTSRLDFHAICRSLGEINYRGIYTLECDKNLNSSYTDSELQAHYLKLASVAREHCALVDFYKK